MSVTDGRARSPYYGKHMDESRPPNQAKTRGSNDLALCLGKGTTGRQTEGQVEVHFHV